MDEKNLKGVRVLITMPSKSHDYDTHMYEVFVVREVSPSGRFAKISDDAWIDVSEIIEVLDVEKPGT